MVIRRRSSPDRPTSWREDLAWGCIGLGTLAQCLLCSVFSFPGIPGAAAAPDAVAHQAREAHTAKVVMTAGAGVGLLTVGFGVCLVVTERREDDPGSP